MTDRDVARSERVLDKIGSRLGLTPEGKEWLICVTDPFNDTPLNVCGYPDTYEAASVVQTVKCSANIAVPSGIDGNWDCHIHNFPWLLPPLLWLGNVVNPILGANSGYGNVQLNPSFESANTVWGGLSVCSVAAGAATYDTGASGTDVPSQPLYTQIKPYLTGEYRIIGMGWEVINTTSDLNIQGLVTCYRQPSPSVGNASTVYMSSLSGTPPTAPAIGWIPVIYDKAPPQNPGTALLLDGSKQWKAKEGCYVVNTLNSDDLLTSGNMTSYVVNLAATDTAISSYNSCVIGLATSQITVIPPTSPTTTFYAIAPDCCLPTQFNASGAYFTGLSNSTTLTLNAVFFIERFPTQNESDLVVLAKHSCRYDPIALDLYGEIIRSMPVGVPQRMNGFGDWFADAVSTASDFISPVLSAIPIPGAGAVGMAVKAAGNVAKSLQSKKESVATYAPTGSNTAVVVTQPKKKTKPAVKAKKKK